MKMLLRAALPAVEARPEVEAESNCDLWPQVLRRLDAEPAAPPLNCNWFDVALLGCLVAFAAFVPASIPMLFYYL